MIDTDRAAPAPSAIIEIGEMTLELPVLRGIDPVLFARNLERGLERLRLSAPSKSLAIDVLTLASVPTRPGDTAVTLAARVCDAISRGLGDRLSDSGAAAGGQR